MHVANIIVADPYPIIHAGIAHSTRKSKEFNVAGHAGDGREALRLIRRLHPDICLTEMYLPGPASAFSIIRSVKREGLPTRVVVLTSRNDGREVFLAMSAGAAGVIHKRVRIDDFLDMLHMASEGQPALCQVSQEAFMDYVHGRSDKTPAGAERQAPELTSREFDILHCAALGLSIKTTAEQLALSVSTVKNHRQNILNKLGVPNLAAAVYHAMRERLLS